MNLLDKLEAAGLTVVAAPNWETNTNLGRDREQTAGIMNHWDAIKGNPGMDYYYRDSVGMPYHMVVKRDDTVYLVGQRYAWHAGKGDPAILEMAENGVPIPDDSPQDNLLDPDDRINGNPHFFSVAINYHPDDGPVGQYDTLVIVNQVLVEHFGLDVGQVFRHMDWTFRKPDIGTIDLAQFRADIEEGMDSMPSASEIADAVWSAQPGGATDPATAWQKLIRTKANTDALVATDIAQADVDAAVDFLLSELPDEVVDALSARLAPGPG